MCAAVRESCAPVLACHGHSWPDTLDCNRFPADEDMCLASLTKEYKYLHKGSWKMAAGRVAMLCVPGNQGGPGDTLPCVNGVTSISTASPCWCCWQGEALGLADQLQQTSDGVNQHLLKKNSLDTLHLDSGERCPHSCGQYQTQDNTLSLICFEVSL